MVTPETEDRRPASTPDDAMSLIEIVNAVLRNWRAVVALPLAFGLVAGIRALNQKRHYAATATFVPQMSEPRSMSTAAALAQQFGVNIGGERAGQSPQFYEGLLRAGTILRRAVESEYQYTGKDGTSARGTLIDYWRLNEVVDPMPAWRRGMERLQKVIATSVRRETGVIELKVIADQPLLAEQIAARLLELLNDYNLEMRQTRARDEARFTSDRLAATQAELRSAEDALEAFLQRNRVFQSSPDLTFQHDRLQRQVAARQEVYEALLRAQEQARMDGMRDTPVLQIIDAPSGTALPQSRKVVMRTVIAFLLGLLLSIGVATGREAARRSRLRNDPDYREFQHLARRLWSEIRNPRRWVSARSERAAAGDD